MDNNPTEQLSPGGKREAIQDTPSPRIVIEMEGGLIHDITANVTMEVLVLDADTEGGDEDQIRQITNWNGNTREAYSRGIEEPEVLPEYADFYFSQFAQEERTEFDSPHEE